MTATAVPALPARLENLPLSPLVNLRDLAGTPVAGGVVGEGFAWRCDDVALIDEASADRLLDDGLRSVIDLRSPAEVAMTGRGVLAARPVSYHHVPFLNDISSDDAIRNGDALHPVGIGRMYVNLVESCPTAVVQALSVLAWSPGATAFHCAAGKDRTGTLAAVTLLALGADDETVVADYARTGANSEAIHERMQPVIGPLMASFGLDLETLAKAAVNGSTFSPDAMRLTLTTLRERHGDPLAPLRAAGLDDALVGRLRERAQVA